MVRIKDIAEAAGVSTTTVSNVIHQNTKKVSPENVKKITELIREMGYEEGQSIKVNRRDNSKLIAVVANCHKKYEESVLSDPFYGEVVGSIEAKLREYGHYMMFYSAIDADDIFRMVKNWDVDGIITITFSSSNCEKLQSYVHKPIVSIDAHEKPNHKTAIPNIGIDNREGGYIMTKHLLEQGYVNIFVCTYKDYGNDHMRWEGAQQAWRDSTSPHKHKLQLDTVGSCWDFRKQYYNELAKHIPFKHKTAAFFLSDYFAMEAQSYLASKGIIVPDQIGVAGFDGLTYGSRWASPSLTTINQDNQKKATLAVDEIVSMLEKPGYQPEDIILPLSLISRDSV